VGGTPPHLGGAPPTHLATFFPPPPPPPGPPPPELPFFFLPKITTVGPGIKEPGGVEAHPSAWGRLMLTFAKIGRAREKDSGYLHAAPPSGHGGQCFGDSRLPGTRAAKQKNAYSLQADVPTSFWHPPFGMSLPDTTALALGAGAVRRADKAPARVGS